MAPTPRDLPPRPPRLHSSSASLRERRGTPKQQAPVGKALPPHVDPLSTGDSAAVAENTEKVHDMHDIHAKIACLRAENECLKEQVEQRTRRLSAVAFLEPADAAKSQREPTFAAHRELLAAKCAQKELCVALQRRSRLEQAVRARHEGLQRFATGSGELSAALADGAAAVSASRFAEPSGRSGSKAGKPSGGAHGRGFCASEVLAVEQLVFGASLALCNFAEASGQCWAEQPARSFQAASAALLQNVHELQTTCIDPNEDHRGLCDHMTLAAALRRKLRRSVPSTRAQVPQATPTSVAGPVDWQRSKAMTTPLAVLKALTDTLEACATERAAERAEIESILVKSLEALADWAAILLAGKDQENVS